LQGIEITQILRMRYKLTNQKLEYDNSYKYE